MSDYRVNVKVRNARLLRAIEGAGYVSGAKFAKASGISYSTLIKYLNLALSPLGRNDNYTDQAMKLCEFLNKGPDDLWSIEQLTPLKTNKAEREVAANQVRFIMHQRDSSTSDPELLIEQREDIGMLNAMIETLSPREQEILRLRHGIDCAEHTLSQAAELFGVSKERVRQIEAKAMRKMRHPDRVEKILNNSGTMNINSDRNYCQRRNKHITREDPTKQLVTNWYKKERNAD
mgnify:FL=1